MVPIRSERLKVPTYNAIQSHTITGSSTTSVNFSSLSGYTDLIIVIHCKNTTTNAYPYLRFNGDSGANYTSFALYANSPRTSVGAGLNVGGYAGATEAYLSNFIGGMSASDFSWFSISQIHGYSDTNVYTNVVTQAGSSLNGGSVEHSYETWTNTATVTSISVGVQSGAFAADSVISLYGIYGG